MLVQASAQRWQASAQRWQCAMACLPHSAPHAWHTWAQSVHTVIRWSSPRAIDAAYIGARHVQRDAANHCFRVVLLETGTGALETGSGTFVARKKAFFLDLTKHNILR